MEWQDNDLSGGHGGVFDETLGKSMRWWSTETADGRLILRRSVLVNYSAMVVLVVGTPCMIYKSLPLMSPYISNYEAKDTMIMVMMLSILVIWAINVLRRRTVLSEDGITMRRLVFTERRPWTSVLSRFTLSTLDLTEPTSYSGIIERTRIAIENGDDDDAIRLPGCVIGMTWGRSEDRASAAVGDLRYYIVKRGWDISEDVALGEDPRLVEARERHKAGTLVRRNRLVFCTPVWRRIKEHLCNGGLFLIGMGVLFMVMGGQQLFFETAPVSGSDLTFAVFFCSDRSPWRIPSTRSTDASNESSWTIEEFAPEGAPAPGRSPVLDCSSPETGSLSCMPTGGTSPWTAPVWRGEAFSDGRSSWLPDARRSGSGVSPAAPLERPAGTSPFRMRACRKSARSSNEALAWRYLVRDSGTRSRDPSVS